MEEAGEDVDLDILFKGSRPEPTRVDNSNPYWIALKEATDHLWVFYTASDVHFTPTKQVDELTDHTYLKWVN